ncbi:MAG: hypothetical protein GY774_31780 [Planctomycetes bacterium]|nr:hypothetical protein [Planctomycetota bacterium]
MIISIVSVNFKSTGFCKLLLDSVRRFSSDEHEVLIWDNSNDLPVFSGLPENNIIRSESNIGHGQGLDQLVPMAMGEYVLVMDIDAHILRSGWEEDLLELYHSNPNTRLVCAPNVPSKRYGPFMMFFEKKHFIEGGYYFRHDYSLRFIPPFENLIPDVGVAFGVGTQIDGHQVELLPVENVNRAGAWVGVDHFLSGKPTFYHHWYGSRFEFDPQASQIDDKRRDNWEHSKEVLFQENKKKYPDAII